MGPFEIGILLLLGLLLFGHKLIPRVARGVSRVPGEFLKGRNEK